ncbi:PREDICTED: protein RKD5 isoform X2 [Nicotiana attenuata]|uniref:protein RKD5 isoform X2 n=1 Tax=Nicotiana attenuata TaxID=49451 RepID=UPI000904A74F|nr:PREDICTED: protein RKD5 isoform X2 [Nicotiana attenuata]
MQWECASLHSTFLLPNYSFSFLCQNSLFSLSVSVLSLMASSQNRTLTALVIFQNFLYPVMFRSVHVYRTEGGKEEMEEREYLFHETSNFEETGFAPVITLHKFDVSAQFVGIENGVWKCMFVYDSGRHQSTSTNASPEWLSFAEDSSGRSSTEESGGNNIKSNQPDVKRRVPFLDLNSLPYSDSDIEENDQNASENKKRRAATKDIARLALEDLAKYFDLPIVEASKSLKVGLTVLKKKCREFGIPRWPHRKIKSLDSLIHDLQEEMQRQQEEDELAAIAVEERKRRIEYERESIEKKPFMDIQKETKKFRQDIFKRRYKARVLENQCRT